MSTPTATIHGSNSIDKCGLFVCGPNARAMTINPAHLRASRNAVNQPRKDREHSIARVVGILQNLAASRAVPQFPRLRRRTGSGSLGRTAPPFDGWRSRDGRPHSAEISFVHAPCGCRAPALRRLPETPRFLPTARIRIHAMCAGQQPQKAQR